CGELVFLFFFFQAEDGIRDGHVTGVQTCALPIWSGAAASCRRAPCAPSRPAERPARAPGWWTAPPRARPSARPAPPPRRARRTRSEERRVGKEGRCRRAREH